MYSCKLPFDLGDILLTPQEAGLPSSLQMPFLILICLLPLVLMLWLYRYELQLVARTTALVLLCLRLIVLAILLLLVCLQPVYGRTRSDHLPGRVLVAVDRSNSMEIADPQRPPLEKLRLARALHLADGICSAEQLDEWIADYEQKGSPQRLKPNESRQGEKDRRSAHEKLGARVDVLSRSQTANRILGADGLRLMQTLAEKHQVELLGFHREAWEVQPERMEELFRASAENPGAAFTDLRLPLTHALERSGPEQSKILGIVLLTDGQHNSGEPPTAKARELGERGVPIYPIALGARTPPPDAAMVSLQAPNTVFKDVDTVVEAAFQITGLEAQDFLVELHRPGKDGAKVLAQRRVHHEGKDRTYSESFPVRMDEAGTQTLSASIRPVTPDVKETSVDNNSRTAIIRVADDKANVLLIDGEARWEYHYLAAALQRDRTLKIKSVVFQQPRLNSLVEGVGRVEGGGWRVEGKDKPPPSTLHPPPSTLHPPPGGGLPQQHLPLGPDALAEFDCIILGDVPVEQLPLAERQRLEKYVAERGGTLVIVPGKRFMPLAYPESDAKGATDPLRKLLPIETPLIFAPVDGLRVTLTGIGRETKFMEMDADPAKSASIWHGLPRHYWAVVGEAKPGATTLAYAAVADGSEQTAEKEKRGLIVKQNYGFGRVLFVGLDSTWRWRYRVGDAYHHTFWGAVLRWAASDKPLMIGNDYIRFGTSQPIYAHDEAVKIVVRLNEELGPIKPDLLAAARLFALGQEKEKEKTAALVPLSRRMAQPRVLDGQVRDLPPGEYAIELDIPDYSEKLQAKPSPPSKPSSGEAGKPLRARFLVKPPESKEMIDLQTRWPLLQEIAGKSGGKVFAAEDAAELVALLVNQSVVHHERFEQKLWQWWVLLAVVLALLTLEWLGRKLAGLP